MVKSSRGRDHECGCGARIAAVCSLEASIPTVRMGQGGSSSGLGWRQALPPCCPHYLPTIDTFYHPTPSAQVGPDFVGPGGHRGGWGFAHDLPDKRAHFASVVKETLPRTP